MDRRNKDRNQISDSSFAQIKPHIYSQKLKNKYERKKFFQVTLSTVFWFYLLNIRKTAPPSEDTISSFTISSNTVI